MITSRAGQDAETSIFICSGSTCERLSLLEQAKWQDLLKIQMHMSFEAVTPRWGTDPKPREIQLEPKDVQEEVSCRIPC